MEAGILQRMCGTASIVQYQVTEPPCKGGGGIRSRDTHRLDVSREKFVPRFVHCRKVFHVRNEDIHLQDLVEAALGLSEDCLKVLEDPSLYIHCLLVAHSLYDT